MVNGFRSGGFAIHLNGSKESTLTYYYSAITAQGATRSAQGADKIE